MSSPPTLPYSRGVSPFEESQQRSTIASSVTEEDSMAVFDARCWRPAPIALDLPLKPLQWPTTRPLTQATHPTQTLFTCEPESDSRSSTFVPTAVNSDPASEIKLTAKKARRIARLSQEIQALDRASRPYDFGDGPHLAIVLPTPSHHPPHLSVLLHPPSLNKIHHHPQAPTITQQTPTEFRVRQALSNSNNRWVPSVLDSAASDSASSLVSKISTLSQQVAVVVMAKKGSWR
ncbi:hypothetical protein BDZ97DRAFT_1926504 [Flammula alnicola]|nr:hypothetical protein BDZ97DRAFT_1926504 [Flammula alnicola]